MLETIKLIEEAKTNARQLDQALIEGRQSVVRRNVAQIDKPRSEKFVGRMAGISSDVYRKSRTELAVEWIGVTALEDAAKLAQVEAFFSPIFNYSPVTPLWSMKDFWASDEHMAGLQAKLRKAFFDGDRGQARIAVCRIRQEVEAMMRIVNAMPEFDKV